MSDLVYLDPAKVARYEPSEGDDRDGWWISPFDVPKYIQTTVDEGDLIRVIRFDYTGGETGDPRKRQTLDDENDPEILVFVGRYSGKILEMNFGRPIPFSELPAIGERLIRQAKNVHVLSTRFNYLMISNILKHWSEVIDRVH
jgi:hypothetical protein